MKNIYIIISFLGLLASILLLIREGFNPISRLALLIIIFLMAAFLFLILDFYFLGLTYIIVYIGAITILFLFVIMVLRTNDNYDLTIISSSSSSSSYNYILFLLLFLLFSILFYLFKNDESILLFSYFYPSWSFDFITFTDIQSLGFLIFLAYPLTLYLLGLILLIILIGILRITK